MSLTEAEQQFILHWGEMSTRWGINRSVAQIHALLYLRAEPRNAEEICTALGLARSNVSTSLRELQAWGVVRIVHRLGDRRDYFEAESDVWQMLLAILDARKRREIDPTLEMLRSCLERDEYPTRHNDTATTRMRELLDLMENLVVWYEQMRALPHATQRRVLRMGRMVAG